MARMVVGRIRRDDGTAIEAYGDGRYITVIGRRYANAPNTLPT